MDSIFQFLGAQNGFVSTLITALFFAGLAVGVIHILRITRRHRSRIIYFILIPIFVVAGLLITNNAIDSAMTAQKLTASIPQQVDDMKKHKVFAVIFQNYPQEETDLREAVKTAKTSEEAETLIKNTGSKLINKYFYPNIIKAPDELMLIYINLTSQIMHELEPLPVSCYEYFAGTSGWRTSSKIPVELLDKELEVKGDIIEAGIKNTTPPKLDKIEVAMNNIYIKYYANKYDPRELQYLSALDKVPPEDACKIAIHFTDTVISMGKDGSQAMKSLINLQINGG